MPGVSVGPVSVHLCYQCSSQALIGGRASTTCVNSWVRQCLYQSLPLLAVEVGPETTAPGWSGPHSVCDTTIQCHTQLTW